MKTVNTFGVDFTLRQTKKHEGQLPIYVGLQLMEIEARYLLNTE